MNSRSLEVSKQLDKITESFSSLLSSIELLKKKKLSKKISDTIENTSIRHTSNENTVTSTLDTSTDQSTSLSLPSDDQFLDTNNAIDNILNNDFNENIDEDLRIDTSDNTSDKKDDEISSLGQDWDFLLNSEFAKQPPPQEESSDEVLDKEKDKIIDNIIVDDLPLILEETSELIPEIEELLERLDSGDKNVIEDLHRKVHTIKGTVGQVGAMRARASFHEMENVMEELVAGRFDPQSKKIELIETFNTAKKLVRELETGEWMNNEEVKISSSTENIAPVQAPRSVRVNTEVIDKMILDLNEGRLSGIGMEDLILSMQLKIRDLEESGQRVSKMLRDIELQAEMQIQSHKAQIQETGLDFDPLEFDRFTGLQELSRLVGEGVTDMLEVRRELSRSLIEQEGIIAQLRRSVQTSLEKLHKTRLTPVDAINDTLYGVVWSSAREMGKDIAFEMIGGRVELDRVLLEKIINPLKHILRNSVAHGIEDPDTRVSIGKNRKGLIRMSIRQEAGKAILSISDDGQGLDVDKIKSKAIEKGLWSSDKPMNDKQAAEMICTPSFSTADELSQIAGRGVGMDVVRSEILSLGGKFEIASKYGQGLFISIQLPTTVASASVLVVESGGESWAFPIEMVEHVTLLDKDHLNEIRQKSIFSDIDGKFKDWEGCSFKRLNELTGIFSASSDNQDNSPVLLLKERGSLMAVEVSRLVQVYEVPLRPAGSIWGNVKGVAGTVILPNGDAIFLVDPFGFDINKKRVDKHSYLKEQIVDNIDIEQIKEGDDEIVNKSSSIRNNKPLVMVVDDSLTVRKATTRFLEKNGYESICAKDGQDALEILIRVKPDLILMDIEMPKMDGFDCTRNIRENVKHKDIPIIMITSRTADKHRQHALDLGVNEYLGKPFKDQELLSLLSKYIYKK